MMEIMVDLIYINIIEIIIKIIMIGPTGIRIMWIVKVISLMIIKRVKIIIIIIKQMLKITEIISMTIIGQIIIRMEIKKNINAGARVRTSPKQTNYSDIKHKIN